MTTSRRTNVNLRFSGLMLRTVNYERVIEVDAQSLGAALDELEQRHPQVRRILRDAQGEVRRAHQIFLNGERVPAKDMNLSLPLQDADEVEFLTAIAGG